jgi:lysophospholipase L1-like esterase
MKKHLTILLGALLVCWASYGFADEGPMIPVVQAATFPTKELGSIAAIGDSITAAFNAAHSEFESCEYNDTPEYSFSTNTNTNTTVSIAERAIAYKGSGIATANFGQDGARMAHGDDQAQAAKTWLLSQATPRLITVFLGHNDICSGERDKYLPSCSSLNRDPNNYCRPSVFAYEQQMRQMLDVLVTIPDSQIAIIHPIRVSQLCNYKEEKVVDEWWVTRRCRDLWKMSGLLPEIFEQDGVCPSLTDCTVDRVTDAFTTWVAYRDISNKVVNEYNLYAAGETIPSNLEFGTGNVVRESNVFLLTTDVIGNAKFKYRDVSGNVQLSVCECFHPSKYGQNTLASSLWNSVACSPTTPCCNDSIAGDSDYNKGLCKKYTTTGWIGGPWAGLEEDKTITVDTSGSGTGMVTSRPAGIDCGSTCQGSFPQGTTVKLTAKAGADSVFRGWSGICDSKVKTCTVGMSDDHAVTATFVSDPTIKATPSRKNYGRVRITRTRTAIFTIRNKTTNGKKDLVIGAITADNAAFVLVDDACSGTTVPPKGSCRFKVRFVPVTGLQNATIEILSNDPAVAMTEISLTGQGVP